MVVLGGGGGSYGRGTPVKREHCTVRVALGTEASNELLERGRLPPGRNAGEESRSNESTPEATRAIQQQKEQSRSDPESARAILLGAMLVRVHQLSERDQIAFFRPLICTGARRNPATRATNQGN